MNIMHHVERMKTKLEGDRDPSYRNVHCMVIFDKQNHLYWAPSLSSSPCEIHNLSDDQFGTQKSDNHVLSTVVSVMIELLYDMHIYIYMYMHVYVDAYIYIYIYT